MKKDVNPSQMEDADDVRVNADVLQRLAMLLMVVAALLIGPCARAEVLSSAANHWKIDRFSVALKINADLTNSWEAVLEYEALTEQGAQVIGQWFKSYNRDLESASVIEAYTQKPDGRKIPVDQGGIQVQSGVVAGGNGVSWPNVNIIKVTFPNVQTGDKTYIRFEGKESKLPLNGWFHRAEYADPAFTWGDISFTVQAPSNVPIHLFSEGLAVQRSEDNGQVRWEGHGSFAAKRVEPRIANILTSMPRVLISSFSKQEQLAEAYAEANNQKVLLDEEVMKLALAITKGKTTTRAQAQAIHDWIRDNVRYVASLIGVGGYVAHDVADILKSHYGDCKDYQLLFQTLLKAVNIEAVPVLINAGSPQFDLPELPVGFDHVITYIPSLELFVDATATTVPFGNLSWNDSDRPVVTALPGGAVVMRTPAATPLDNTVDSHAVWNIHADGSASLDMDIQTTGITATELQDELERIPSGGDDTAVRWLLSESGGLQGTGSVYFGALQRNKRSQNLKVQMEIKDLLSDPSGGSVSPNPHLAVDVYARTQLGLREGGLRQFATTCTPIKVRESFEMHFDKAFKIVRVPSDFTATNPDGIQFSAHYVGTDNTIKGSRELELSQKRHLCKPDAYAGRLPTLTDIARHLKGTVIFTQ